MAMSWLQKWFNKKSKPVTRLRATPFGRNRFLPALEGLTERIVPAVTASLSQAGELTVIGDALDNHIVISRDAAGAVQVNGGAVAVTGGIPTATNVLSIRALGLGGNDVMTLDEANGALPRAELIGGTGDDTLTGGSGADRIFGQAGNDVLIGNNGNDFAQGDDGNDMIFLGAGNDTFQAVPGAGNDIVEGEDGVDQMLFYGSNAAEAIDLAAADGRVHFTRDSANADLDGVEQLDIRVFGGADQIVVGDLSGTAMTGMSLDLGSGDGASDLVMVRGTEGNDTLGLVGDSGYVRVYGLQAPVNIFSNGAADRLTVNALAGTDVMDARSLRAGGVQLTMHGDTDADTIIGSEGNDLITGGAGDDTVRMNTGDDTFVWNPGDGSDTIEGQAGADAITINAVSGTDVAEINIDLGVDTHADTVTVIGTQGDDIIDIYGWDTNLAVLGLSPQVNIAHVDADRDALVVNSMDGADGVTATTLEEGIVKLTIDSGAGDDMILGSQGADILRSGAGDDFVYANHGDDLVHLGSGDDLFEWDAGDGSDSVEGQDGADRLVAYGSDANETIEVSANGERVLVAWDSANVDSADVEQLDLRVWGGADNIVVNDLSGTDVTGIALDLGRDDASADTVTIRGTESDDTIGVLGDSGWVYVYGLQATVSIFSNEIADSLTVDALAGADVVNAASLREDAIQLTLHGGVGDDTLIGSDGDDLITGGDGDDVLHGGPGLDVLDGGPGDDTIFQ